MIRNAVIHLNGEQPVVADLFATPGPTDVNLVCTNMRTLDGKRPVFVDASGSTFVFPYTHIRFVEIREEAPSAGAADARPEPAAAPAPVEAGPGRRPGPEDEELAIDEDFLRRVRDA